MNGNTPARPISAAKPEWVTATLERLRLEATRLKSMRQDESARPANRPAIVTVADEMVALSRTNRLSAEVMSELKNVLTEGRLATALLHTAPEVRS